MQRQRYSHNCDCGLKIQRVLCGTELGADTIKAMENGGTAGSLSFTSKAGKPFSARLKVAETERGSSVEFVFDNKKGKR